MYLSQNRMVSMGYINEFFGLKCSGDVLNAVGRLGHEPTKEISESMGITKRIKSLLIPNPGKYNILDLCAGNALTSVLASHLYKLDHAVAVDRQERVRNWDIVKGFKYVFQDIYDSSIFDLIDKNTIIISVHCCGNLAKRIREIYEKSQAKALFMMPCCLARLEHRYPEIIEKKLGNYMLFCWDLTYGMENPIMIVDDHILSPKNIIIKSVRNE